jgi:hypothetical protein
MLLIDHWLIRLRILLSILNQKTGSTHICFIARAIMAAAGRPEMPCLATEESKVAGVAVRPIRSLQHEIHSYSFFIEKTMQNRAGAEPLRLKQPSTSPVNE